MSEVKNNTTGGSNVRPLNSAAARRTTPLQNNVRYFDTARGTQANSANVSNLSRSEGGFNFTGLDSFGEIVKGFVQTPEATLAAKELERAGIRVQTISERRKGREKNRRPTRVELATLAEQFGELMEVGESPTQICRLLAQAQTNKVLEIALLNAGELVMNGWGLSEAFAAQRDNKENPIFPVTFICALRIGEEVGTAADSESGVNKSAFLLTLNRFAEGEKRADSIRSKIRSAMMYPIAVVLFCFVAVGVVEYFVMPKMVELYNSLLTGEDTKLPLVTRIMIGGSDFLTSWFGIIFVILLILGAILFFRWAKSKDGSDKLKVWSLRMPVFGSFFRHYNAAQTLRTMAMLSAGIPSMTERFQIAGETSDNPEYARMLMHVRQRFMTESTDLHKLFVPYPFLMGKEFAGVLMTFERTADMQNTFHNYAKVVEVRAERELEAVLFWFQNFAIVPVGIFVGFIVAALYSPMFELAGRIGSK
ncbi:MAG TPA: type II secretion system F family protein [Pyrinomonadaceae bacterium]|jgi:type IV pilus assembly protein PilC|nr:type II secretion system F family protein [Pyrinomonadaceae bacterium]